MVKSMVQYRKCVGRRKLSTSIFQIPVFPFSVIHLYYMLADFSSAQCCFSWSRARPQEQTVFFSINSCHRQGWQRNGVHTQRSRVVYMLTPQWPWLCHCLATHNGHQDQANVACEGISRCEIDLSAEKKGPSNSRQWDLCGTVWVRKREEDKSYNPCNLCRISRVLRSTFCAKKVCTGIHL